MKPPKEKRLQKTGSRSTSAGASASAWTVSRPGFQASDSWAEPISSAMSDPSEDQIDDGARDSEPQEHVDSEDDLPGKRLPCELDRLGLPDQHEPGERVPYHEGEEDDVQIEDRRRPQPVPEPPARAAFPGVLSAGHWHHRDEEPGIRSRRMCRIVARNLSV